MKDKIRILFFPSDLYGVGNYRQIWPARMIQKNHSDEFHVDVMFNLPVKETIVGKYDIVHYHRRVGMPDESINWIRKLKENGSILIADNDDFWTPPHGHPSRELALRSNLPLQIVENTKEADYITTTTNIFKRIITEKFGKEYENKIKVIPNAIDPEMEMWNPIQEKSDKIRISWIGGSSHERDLNRIKGTFNLLFNDPQTKDKIQVVMCGYDTRGTITERNPNTGEEKTRKIRPEESIWNRFEKIFNDYDRATPEQYMRRNTLPINQYGKHYRYCDICLAPLDQNIFNECKSELKIIEAGMMSKALIASDLYVYKELLTHGETAMLVEPRKDHKLWYKYIKELVLNEELRNSLQKNLYNFVYPRYNLAKVTKDRCEWYKEILK